MRKEPFSRPGVGCRSCQKRSTHVLRLVFPGLAAMPLPHDRNGCGSNAEQVWIGIVNVDADRKSRREMHPVEGALDVGQAAGDTAVFGKDTIADAFHMTSELAVRVSHHV